MIDFVLWMAVAYLLLPLVFGPFYLKFNHWVAANPAIRPIAPDKLATGVREYIDNVKKEFSDLGFAFKGYSNLAGYAPGVVTTFALFHHEDLKREAMAAVVQFHAGNTVEYCEFSTRYTSGSIVNVNNSPVLGAYTEPRKKTYRFPRIRSVKKLFTINEGIRRHDLLSQEPVELKKAREPEMMVEALRSEIRQQAECGYYFLDERRERYLPTWKGAVMMTLRHVFPIKQIRDLMDLHEAKSVVRKMQPDV